MNYASANQEEMVEDNETVRVINKVNNTNNNNNMSQVGMDISSNKNNISLENEQQILNDPNILSEFPVELSDTVTSNILNNNRKIHSILALFYYMPATILISLVPFFVTLYCLCVWGCHNCLSFILRLFCA